MILRHMNIIDLSLLAAATCLKFIEETTAQQTVGLDDGLILEFSSMFQQDPFLVFCTQGGLPEQHIGLNFL